MFKDPAQPFAPRFKSHLKLFKRDAIPQVLKDRGNVFRTLLLAALEFSLEISELPKVARSDVWRVGWTGSSENLQVP
jgi:hypothetical protein